MTRLILDHDKPLSLEEEHRALRDRVVEYASEHPEWRGSPYGHAACNLTTLYQASKNVSHTQEEQRAFLIRKRDEYIAKFGPVIVNFLREELRIDLDRL